MEGFITVPNLLNALMIVSVWAIKSELTHIRKDIEAVAKAVNSAHDRIDKILLN